MTASLSAHNSPDAADTIVAVSTAAGCSLRAIVRMSGPRSLETLEHIIIPKNVSAVPHGNYRAFNVDLLLDGIRLPARVYLMRAPTSYTREDVVELHVFGSPPLLKALLDAVVRRGARPAEPGEFTRRAFINGRLDLAQAEAVERLIRARSDVEYRAALGALSGQASRQVRELRNRLADLAACVEVSLDFADQDVEIISRDEIIVRLAPLRAELEYLLAGREDGRVGTHVARVVLYGPTNAGKSSLFNAMLRQRRAIVSPHPGTTRDTVEAVTRLDDTELLLVDTAGLCSSEDDLENAALERSRDAIRRADLPLCVLDCTEPPSDLVREALDALPAGRGIVVLNKCDLGCTDARLMAMLPSDVEKVRVSALTGEGMPRLLETILNLLRAGRVDRSAGDLMINSRQADLLQRALAAMRRACDPDCAQAMDLIADDLREALIHLSHITGEAVTEDVLDRIFASFCIGK